MMLHTVGGDQAVHTVQRAGQPDRSALQRAAHAVIVFCPVEFFADLGVDMRIARQQRSVAAIDREGVVAETVVVIVRRDLLEELLEIVGEAC